MKKLKKLFVALLAAALLLSLTVPALANTLVDPDLCQFCGIGTYSSTPPWHYKNRIDNLVPCRHGWSGEQDGILLYVYAYEESCNNRSCPCYPQRLQTFERYAYDICTHEYTGMSLGDEIR